MNRRPQKSGCDQTERVALHALGALPPAESNVLRAHIESCAECQLELEGLQPVMRSFASWPTDLLRPSTTLWDRLAQRVAADSGTPPLPAATMPEGLEPEWEQVAPDISCKLLATDTERHRVSMLVRLAPGGDYPPHTHADTEELHLLAGELWIDDRKLHPGDYNRAEPDTADRRVWSETGCTCVLITSSRDAFS
jgi:anti-sigma factor ChrR (cupin superfamily)